MEHRRNAKGRITMSTASMMASLVILLLLFHLLGFLAASLLASRRPLVNALLGGPQRAG